MVATIELYARKCETCANGMNVGFMYQWGTYCTMECLPITEAEWNEIDHENSEESYWSEWEEFDEGIAYTVNGAEIDLYEGAEL